MNIAIAFSPNWSKYVAILVYSIFKNNKSPIKVYLLSENLSYTEMMYFNKLHLHFGQDYKCVYIDMKNHYQNNITSDINVDGRFSKYTLYRLLLPKLVTDDKLLYIDADTVVNGDLSELYNIDFKDNLIAGVLDCGVDDYKSEIDFKKEDLYINAGVTLMNLKQIRELELDKTWLEMVNTKWYPMHDQCIMNITCKNKIIPVDLKYNVSLSTGLDIQESDAKIIHYAGTKPWNSNETIFYDAWEKLKNEFESDIESIKLPKIPKIIHYCWFGKNEKPLKIQRCLESWQKIMPDYKIIEWNEDNFDINSNQFVKEAYENKKWAFVTDYVRLWALYNFGGIYMDSDVEVIKPLDEFLYQRAFTGHETDEMLICATMGAEPRHGWIEYLLSYYSKAKFDMTANTKIITAMTKPYVEKEENGFTYVKQDVVIYPTDYFCPFDHKNMKPMMTENTYTIHHFCGSWLDKPK